MKLGGENIHRLNELKSIKVYFFSPFLVILESRKKVQISLFRLDYVVLWSENVRYSYMQRKTKQRVHFSITRAFFSRMHHLYNLFTFHGIDNVCRMTFRHLIDVVLH